MKRKARFCGIGSGLFGVGKSRLVLRLLLAHITQGLGFRAEGLGFRTLPGHMEIMENKMETTIMGII